MMEDVSLTNGPITFFKSWSFQKSCSNTQQHDWGTLSLWELCLFLLVFLHNFGLMLLLLLFLFLNASLLLFYR